MSKLSMVYKSLYPDLNIDHLHVRYKVTTLLLPMAQLENKQYYQYNTCIKYDIAANLSKTDEAESYIFSNACSFASLWLCERNVKNKNGYISNFGQYKIPQETWHDIFV